MRIAVTGASGDSGACIVPELLSRGHDVHGVSRGPHEVRAPNYRHSRVDVRDSDALADVVSGADAVVHLAWTTHPSHDVAATYGVDIGGTQAVLTAMKREMARDATIRYTHNYRLIARELGLRLTQRGILEHPDDVFYLVRSELSHPPADARALVARRRAERIRLSQARPPLEFSMRWEPETGAVAELQPGGTLSGTPVSAGVAKGVVRVLTPESTDDFEPGEVLVTQFTDVGWTPFFSYAAAVVVDTGSEMSHAAVVAREFGIPCVGGTVVGSRALRSGLVVEVDGSSGLVTRVE